MTRSKQIANRLQEVLLDGHWVAQTNIKKQIENLTWHQAIQKTNGLNTIAALTFHMNYYLGGVIQVLEGGELEIRDKYSFDLPPIRSERDWKNLVSSFLDNSKKIIELIEKMEDAQLDKSFVDKKYGTYQRNIEAIIEHNYYHLGQISLIKKMITSQLE